MLRRPSGSCSFKAWGDEKTLPSSVYCLASSATASPILFLTAELCSPSRHCSILARMALRCGSGSVRNSSLVWSVAGSFRFLTEMRLNNTEANERVCEQSQPGLQSCATKKTYSSVLCQLYLLGQAHEQNLGLGIDPVVVERLLGLGACDIVGRLQTREQLGQGRVHLGRKHRHVGTVVRLSKRALERGTGRVWACAAARNSRSVQDICGGGRERA